MYCTQPIETMVELFTRASEKLPPLGEIPGILTSSALAIPGKLASATMTSAASLKNRVVPLAKEVYPPLIGLIIMGIAATALTIPLILLGSPVGASIAFSLALVLVIVLALSVVRN